MDKILIEDPNDIYYPLRKETFEDTNVFYHGSNENYSENVEKNGFIRGSRPYDPDKLKEFAEICNKIDDSGLVDLDHYAKTDYEKRVDKFHRYDLTIGSHYLRTSIENITFTTDYWEAMRFSLKQGGETIRAAVGLAKAVCELLPDWKGKINNQLKEKAENSTKEILDLYKKIFDNHIPCIYAVRLDSELDEYVIDYSEVKRNIPKESIIARVVYPCGIGKQAEKDLGLIDHSGRHNPLPWKKDEWESYKNNRINLL